MGYIGNEPTTGHFPVDNFTSSGGSTYTLAKAPASAGAIEVSVQGVLQPTTAYTVSGTTLTMAGVTTGVKIFVRHLGETLSLPTPADGSVTTAKLGTNSVDGTKIAMGSDARGDILYHGATDYARLAKGTSGQVLTMGANDPAWAAAAGGVDGITSAANATAISIDSTERVTMPLQPSFAAYLTSNATSVIGGGTVYNITGAFTERFDIGSNFNAANGTFTAPVTGKYLLYTWIAVGGIDTAHSYYQAYFTTANFTYRFDHGDFDGGFSGTHFAKGSVVADMDTSDTAYLTYTLTGSSTGTANINGGTTGVWFGGMLIG